MTVIERLEQLEESALLERVVQLEAMVKQLQAELGIAEPAIEDPADDFGPVLDLDSLDQPYGAEVDGLGAAHDEIPYPDLDAAIHAESVKRGYVDPEGLGVALSDKYWSAEDLEHDIRNRVTDLGFEIMCDTGLYIHPDFGALLDEVQDLRNLSQDALPAYREYAAAELQRRRDAGKKYKAPYRRKLKPAIDWAAVEQEPAVAKVAV
jgi:hypothetical protein